ncbi:class I SAM-dependent methyltransferase [Actinokineospora sp. NPDC004072]
MNAIARGWDEAADGYLDYFVPRFAPWVSAAVHALPELPDGPVLVPCCGPFPELAPLAARFPGREIVGIDLSAGMVQRAADQARRWPGAKVVHGDATDLGAWTGCAAVVSVFGLQQMPDPERAIASWAAALAPGGWLSVVYWPEETESDGPFARVKAVLGGPSADRSWEGRLLAGVDVVVERDERPSFPMTHASAETFIDAYLDSGPMRSRAPTEEFVQRIRADFLKDAPEGVWEHRPRARLILARR